MIYLFVAFLCFFASLGVVCASVLPVFTGLAGPCAIVFFARKGDRRQEFRLKALGRLRGAFFKAADVYIVDCGVTGEELTLLRRLAEGRGFDIVAPDELREKLSGGVVS